MTTYIIPGAAGITAATVAPTATGIAATDTANLQAAINSVPAGGRLFIRTSAFGVHYKINAALTIPRSMDIEGDGVAPTFATATAGGSPIMPIGLVGTIIEQTAAGLDGILISASAVSLNLRRLGILFTAGLASTGHGVNASPAQTFSSGHDLGLTDFHFENVLVYGHDGNHYGFRWLNPQYGTVAHCRAYGGGGYNTIVDPGAINGGNIVFIHPYVAITNVGTAGGYVHSGSSATPGTLNLLTYIRPQCIVNSAVANAATNPLWDDLQGSSYPRGVSVYAADLETAGANLFRTGAGTTFNAIGLINGANTSSTVVGYGAFPAAISSSNGTATAFGSGALAALTTGQNNVGVGGSALSQTTTGSDNTAVGNIALQKTTTGGSNTAIGSNALNANVANSSNTAIGSNSLSKATADNNTAIGAVALQNATTGASNTAIGGQAFQALTTGGVNVAVGQSAGVSLTTGSNNTFLGYKAGVTNTGGNAVTTSSQNIYIGCFAGPSSSSQLNGAIAIGYNATTNGTNATALGTGTAAGASGSVAIGHDSSGGSATTTVQNAFVLGTALHQVQVLNNMTGSGSAALGTNSPAVTPAAPYTWFKMLSGDGSTVYVPAWK